ncbi:hypothetical protein [Afifella sp. IM 167]|uniref:hypothetical protein n=1 Tax=Afifella sp. IM 167 TaxID=2033586 RepID=UPI001CCC3445|nr:hypothetical protein [Afifella sp. IM 167]MBZ8134057.1 hypothetical protein [Afifella sp. IM 167]
MSITLILFWITFGLFAADVVLGKLGVMTGGEVGEFLPDVPHFLLLALSAVFLTAAGLQREARRDAEAPPGEETGPGSPPEAQEEVR